MPRFATSTAPAALASVVLIMFAGCSHDPLARQEVSGNVTLDGAPLAHGSVRFEPLRDAANSEATVITAGAVVQNGSYRIPREVGLPPGKYRVAISAPSQASPAPPSMDTEANVKVDELIPAEYNANSKLEVEVGTDKPNEFNFDIKSKKA